MIKIAVNADIAKARKNETSEKGKRVYRAAIDTIKRLDVILKDKKPYRSAFTQEAVGLRNRLKEYCERLMFLDPHLYGNKAEEVLWRKVFYSVILIAKNNKRKVQSHDSIYSAFRTHMSSATGFYHHLISRLQSQASLCLDGLVDFHRISHSKEAGKDRVVTENDREWALRACHQCLIYLGDIARYQQIFDGGQRNTLAQRYYYQALSLYPNIGMPYNQLGVLQSSQYYTFDSAYHYIRCIVSEISFEATRNNLQRLLDRNRKHYNDIDVKSSRPITADIQRARNLRRLITRFMNLLHIFFNPNQIPGNEDIQEVCQVTLHEFNLCMFDIQVCPTEAGDWSRPQNLTADIVYKMVVSAMAAVHYQQKCGCSQVTAAIAFFLALASHVTNHVVCRLQQILEASQPTSLPTVDNDQEEVEEMGREATNTPTSTHTLTPTPTSKSPPSLQPHKVKSRERLKERRRRRKNTVDKSSGSESSGANSGSDESDLSEGRDNLSLSSLSDDDFIDCSDHGSDSDLDDSFSVPHTKAANTKQIESAQNFPDMQKIWCDEGVGDNLVMFSSELFGSSATPAFLSGKISTKTDTNTVDQEDAFTHEIEQKLANFVIETDTEGLVTDADGVSEDESDSPSCASPTQAEVSKRHEIAIDTLRGEPLLPVIKVISDWLRCHEQIIKTCAQSSQSLWSRLAMLLNLIPSEDAITDNHLNLSPSIQAHLREASEGAWGQTEPLREDINLRCFTPLSPVHERINFDLKSRVMMTEDNELAVRLVCLRQFGYVTSNLPELDFHYKADEMLFIGPIQSNGIVPTDSANQHSAQEKITAAETCKNRLMRDMAQLRLQREVDDLQGELASTTLPTFPPYIVTDHWCLCEELLSVKQLANTGQCVIIIPLSVIDTLDMKKKESIGARNAIRWLESEFKKGNRYVRDQKTRERFNPNPRKHMKKKNREAWEMLMTLDCASYLNRQTGQLCNGNMVTLLVNRDLGEWSKIPDIIHAINSSKNEGVTIEKIKPFHNRWKELWKQAR